MAWPDGAVQLFTSNVAGYVPPDQAGRGVQTTWKISGDPDAPWSYWRIMYNGLQRAGTAVGAGDVTAFTLTNGLPQLLVLEAGKGVARLLTSWAQTQDPLSLPNRLVEFVPAADTAIQAETAAQLPDGRPQLFASW